MHRLCLTVEGQTEQAFASRVLDPQLAQYGIQLRKPRLALFSRSGGRGFRGGMNKYEIIRTDICNWLKQDKDPAAVFSTMFDLYALPKDFPAYDEASRLRDPYQSVTVLEKALADDIGDRRFIPYLQLHEFEALLFSHLPAFGVYYPNHERQIENLEAVLAEHAGQPERIDDGEQTAPSKRIGNEIPEYLGAKPTAGPIVAAAIGLAKIRERCPHFGEWMTKLEQLETKSNG